MKPVVTVRTAHFGDVDHLTYAEQWQDRALHLAAAMERIVLGQGKNPCEDEKCTSWDIAYSAWKDYERSFAEGVDWRGDQDKTD